MQKQKKEKFQFKIGGTRIKQIYDLQRVVREIRYLIFKLDYTIGNTAEHYSEYKVDVDALREAKEF